ncbi:hypothetical protein AK812_SmicGene40334 [Symbiodinium microadriaticum]|uniref:Letm1 RBD domain-containing protein n=1 Tax=Symbiodinium microadriaticum TaxID=2951 RepID=A0A1Q9C8X0_SYMMI|nr:hypothetical protein AK812_SmicGene40334 [Symbiodinium microadriaticum]
MCRAAGLDEAGDFHVYLYGQSVPLIGDAEVETRTGGSIAFVPTDRIPQHRSLFSEMLAATDGWDADPAILPRSAPMQGDHILLTPGELVLFAPIDHPMLVVMRLVGLSPPTCAWAPQLTRLEESDLQYASSLLGKAFFSNYTLRALEVRTLQRTVKDVLTLIPFLIILIIPLSPVGHVLVFSFIQKNFPEFFPSAFTEHRQNAIKIYRDIVPDAGGGKQQDATRIRYLGIPADRGYPGVHIRFELYRLNNLRKAIEYYHRALRSDRNDAFCSEMLNYAVHEEAGKLRSGAKQQLRPVCLASRCQAVHVSEPGHRKLVPKVTGCDPDAHGIGRGILTSRACFHSLRQASKLPFPAWSGGGL